MWEQIWTAMKWLNDWAVVGVGASFVKASETCSVSSMMLELFVGSEPGRLGAFAMKALNVGESGFMAASAHLPQAVVIIAIIFLTSWAYQSAPQAAYGGFTWAWSTWKQFDGWYGTLVGYVPQSIQWTVARNLTMATCEPASWIRGTAYEVATTVLYRATPPEGPLQEKMLAVAAGALVNASEVYLIWCTIIVVTYFCINRIPFWPGPKWYPETWLARIIWLACASVSSLTIGLVGRVLHFDPNAGHELQTAVANHMRPTIDGMKRQRGRQLGGMSNNICVATPFNAVAHLTSSVENLVQQMCTQSSLESLGDAKRSVMEKAIRQGNVEFLGCMLDAAVTSFVGTNGLVPLGQNASLGMNGPKISLFINGQLYIGATADRTQARLCLVRSGVMSSFVMASFEVCTTLFLDVVNENHCSSKAWQPRDCPPASSPTKAEDEAASALQTGAAAAAAAGMAVPADKKEPEVCSMKDKEDKKEEKKKEKEAGPAAKKDKQDLQDKKEDEAHEVVALKGDFAALKGEFSALKVEIASGKSETREQLESFGHALMQNINAKLATVALAQTPGATEVVPQASASASSAAAASASSSSSNNTVGSTAIPKEQCAWMTPKFRVVQGLNECAFAAAVVVLNTALKVVARESGDKKVREEMSKDAKALLDDASAAADGVELVKRIVGANRREDHAGDNATKAVRVVLNQLRIFETKPPVMLSTLMGIGATVPAGERTLAALLFEDRPGALGHWSAATWSSEDAAFREHRSTGFTPVPELPKSAAKIWVVGSSVGIGGTEDEGDMRKMCTTCNKTASEHQGKTFVLECAACRRIVCGACTGLHKRLDRELAGASWRCDRCAGKTKRGEVAELHRKSEQAAKEKESKEEEARRQDRMRSKEIKLAKLKEERRKKEEKLAAKRRAARALNEVKVADTPVVVAQAPAQAAPRRGVGVDAPVVVPAPWRAPRFDPTDFLYANDTSPTQHELDQIDRVLDTNSYFYPPGASHAHTAPLRVAAICAGAVATLQFFDEPVAMPWVLASVTEQTRAQHMRMLRWFASSCPEQRYGCSLVSELLLFFAALEEERRWQPQTTMRSMLCMAGALAQLYVYSPQAATGIVLGQDPLWRRALSSVISRANLAQPINCAAVTMADVVKACEMEPHPLVRAAIALQFACASRVGDIAKLRWKNVHSFDPSTRELQLLFTDTKTSARVGPHAQGTRIPAPLMPHLEPLLAYPRSPQAFVIDAQQPLARAKLRSAATFAMKRVDPAFGTRAIRRGALQAMAARGMPIADIMAWSGHRSENTCRRYLDWGLRLTSQQQAGMDGADAAFLY